MKEKNKKSRWKIPWFDFHIVRGVRLSDDDKKFQALDERFKVLEREFKRQLLSSKIDSKRIMQLQHQIAIFSGRIPPPQCPKCFEPLKAGGVQWISHVKCCAQGKSKK